MNVRQMNEHVYFVRLKDYYEGYNVMIPLFQIVFCSEVPCLH